MCGMPPPPISSAFLKLMAAHSAQVDRTNMSGQQRTEVDGTWAIWEYRRNDGIGDERFGHQVVDNDFSAFDCKMKTDGPERG